MIRKYTFGTPLPTGAVVRPQPAQSGPVPFFDVKTGEDGSVSFSLSLHPEEVIFGLGQAVRGIDKRGHRYESWNSDVFNHTEERSLAMAASRCWRPSESSRSAMACVPRTYSP